jgi:MscS family membrane protein
MLYCFTRTTRWGEWLAIKEKLAYHIKDTVEAAGTGFAFPSRSLYVEALPAEQRDDQPEAFVPPGRNRTESQDNKEGAAPPGPRRGRKEEADVNAEPGPQKGNDGE